MNKKYELLKDDAIKYHYSTLYRIRALKDFNNVKKGDLGGYIEKEENLSHEGNCWVYDNAVVYIDAKVSGNARIFNRAIVGGFARVFDDAEVHGDAVVLNKSNVYSNAKIYDYVVLHHDVEIFGNAVVRDHAEIFNNAEIYGNSMVGGNAKIYDDVRIFGNAKIYDNARIYGYSTIFGNADIFDDSLIENDVVCHTVCNRPNPPISFRIKSLRVEKIKTFDDREEEYENNLLYVFNCIFEVNIKYELRLWTEHGDCYSGWCAASWAHADLIRVDSFIGMTHRPTKELTFNLDVEVVECGKLPDMSNDVFTITDSDTNDDYYPCGEVTVNMNLFEEISRSKEKRPVWIFKGDSVLGKSYLAGIIANSGRMKTVYETDAHKQLSDISHEDIIVIGNKYNYSVEDILPHIQGEFEPIVVDFSRI